MGERFLGRASLDSIPLGGSRTLRVVAVRDGQAPDNDAVLVVELA
jgi:hypothetical protein